jgi:hypothetical protein
MMKAYFNRSKSAIFATLFLDIPLAQDRFALQELREYKVVHTEPSDSFGSDHRGPP